MKFVLLAFALVSSSAFAADKCTDKSGRAAKSVDSISNETALKNIEVRKVTFTKSQPAGGESLDTYRVHLVANQDMAAYYDVQITSSNCIIKSVTYVTGD